MYHFSLCVLFFYFLLILKCKLKILPNSKFLIYQFAFEKKSSKRIFHKFVSRFIQFGSPCISHGNWEVERSFGRCVCCFLYSVTLLITSLMPFGIEESSLGCTAVPPEDLSSVSVGCNSAGDLNKCTSKEYKIFNV